MTVNWTTPDKTNTTWSKGSLNATSYKGRYIVNLGATMNDANYTMGDTTLTMGDYKLNKGFSAPTTWST